MDSLKSNLQRLLPIISSCRSALSEYSNLLLLQSPSANAYFDGFQQLSLTLTRAINDADSIALDISGIVRSSDTEMNCELLMSSYDAFDAYNTIRSSVLSFLESGRGCFSATLPDRKRLLLEARTLICALENFDNKYLKV